MSDLPDELRRLYEAERASAVDVPHGAKARIRASVLSRAVAISAPRAPRSFSPLHLAGAGAVGLALGLAIGVATRRSEPVVIAPVPVIDASVEEIDATVPDAAVPDAEVIDAAVAPRTRRVQDAGQGSELVEERVLVDRAHVAFQRSDWMEALVALAEHERRFPAGALSEERERLVVLSLRGAGRNEAALARIDAYLADRPRGAHRAYFEGLRDELR